MTHKWFWVSYLRQQGPRTVDTSPQGDARQSSGGEPAHGTIASWVLICCWVLASSGPLHARSPRVEAQQVGVAHAVEHLDLLGGAAGERWAVQLSAAANLALSSSA